VKTLVILLGPPAVGKMATGKALEELTGLPLLHNHMTIEPVLPFFEFGSPPFSRLVGDFRRHLFQEVAESGLPGMIFTWVWAFDEPGDREFIDEVAGIFKSRGGRIVFVELWADLETRLRRNRTELRLREKPSKRDVEASEVRLLAAEERHRMSSDGDFPFPDHLRIDNTGLDPEEAARRIAARFSLARMATIRCPQCGHPAREPVPTDACLIVHECPGCGARIRPKEGDCCVFCSYGSEPCPSALRSGPLAPEQGADV
jgi:hypothetical protein